MGKQAVSLAARRPAFRARAARPHRSSRGELMRSRQTPHTPHSDSQKSQDARVAVCAVSFFPPFALLLLVFFFFLQLEQEAVTPTTCNEPEQLCRSRGPFEGRERQSKEGKRGKGETRTHTVRRKEKIRDVKRSKARGGRRADCCCGCCWCAD